MIVPRAVLFMNESRASAVRALLPWDSATVATRSQLTIEARRPGTVIFIDRERLTQLDDSIGAPIVCIIEAGPQEFLSNVISLLEQYPRVIHHIGASLLSKPHAASYLEKLVARLALGEEPSMVSDVGVGRVALLAQSNRRETRLERMREFLEKHAIGERLIAKACDVFEELATNALYDAPLEAGFFPEAIPRTEEVELPLERACQVTYGVEDDTVVLRVRDPFGALPLRRLIAVLKRCNRVGAELDESRGGAGLGMWRVFSLASTISITVVPDKLTEIVVSLTSGSRAKQLNAIHLDFAQDSGFDTDVLENQHADYDLLDHSITLIRVA
ncbi:MAG TPA: hypothetical protein VGM90_30925 [Kofleriaceae bacterium]